MSRNEANLAVTRAAREHYGRLLSHLAFAWRDPAGAEDALADAFAAALEQWPIQGVPNHPDAWLLTVARNRLRSDRRHRVVQRTQQVTLTVEIERLLAQTHEAPSVIADDRLRLMFVCAHPAIDPSIRSALMLQLILGVEVQKLAAVFLVPPATLAQRLVRAKAKIRAAGLPFEYPDANAMPSRVGDVLEAIYGAYTRGRTLSELPSAEADELGDEALRLAELVAVLEPARAEALGLCALLCYSEARRASRFSADGSFVPLAEQNTVSWDHALIERGERLLEAASAMREPGPLQLEAAIQSAHCSRRLTGETPWPIIAALYTEIIRHWPSVGAAVSRSVALSECHRFDEALRALDAIEPSAQKGYAAYWAARGHALAGCKRDAEASACYDRAAGLTAHPSVRRFLLQKSSTLARATMLSP